jgi:acetyl-CoA C-acetyltransferase
MIQEAFIFDAIRTPRGRGKDTGSLRDTSAIDLISGLMTALVARTDLDTSQVEDVILGCVTPIAEQGGNIARIAALYADWHVDVPGIQVNRFCASGLSAVNDAAMRVRAGWGDLVVAGGIESMSRVKMGSDGGAWMTDSAVIEKLAFVPQGISADLIATIEGFSRDEVDHYALLSQRRAARAEADGYFASRIPVQAADGTVVLDYDQHARPDASIASLAGLYPVFKRMGEGKFDAMALRKYPQVDHIEHVHTAGNSSGIVDGAALVLVGSAEKGRQLNLTPRARIVSAALVGTEPTIMLIGPAPASKKALQMAGMSIDDIDLIECNEAFAAVPLRFMREMGLDSAEKVNVNGGAIALGHPLGATGAMLLGTALDELERRDKETALITLCAGGGMGIATVIERV